MCDGGEGTTQVDKQGLPDDAKGGVTRHLFQKRKSGGSNAPKNV